MSDILHRVGIKSSSKDTYTALTTLDGLARWWTSETKGEGQVGGVIQFRFGSRGGFDMKVLELEPAQRVLWQVVSGPAEWLGTKVSFELRQEGGFTLVSFKHDPIAGPSDAPANDFRTGPRSPLRGARPPLNVVSACSNEPAVPTLTQVERSQGRFFSRASRHP